MKRQREELTVEPLGATEFAATLNGADPNAVYRCLKRFARIVRRERRQALAAVHSSSNVNGYGSSDEEESDESDVDDSHDAEAQKRVKKEETWKEDSANYNVPFVGTSVSAKDVGTVVVGEWPTGLLKAYLTRSPLAVELTGDDLIPGQGRLHKTLAKNKKGRLSRAIYKSYLQVMSEVITAAIPMETLAREMVTEQLGVKTAERDLSHATPYSRLVTELVKKLLPGLLSALKEETGNNKRTVSGHASLSPLLLEILARLSMTSAETCRQLVRSLQSSFPERNVRILVKPLRANETDDKSKQSSSLSTQLTIQAHVLDLARVCLEWQDHVIISTVSSSGARDRKISPGFAFLAVKEVF